ncbi:MAG: hypothetical protein ACXVGH_03905 [Mycobacteriales bacterium]
MALHPVGPLPASTYWRRRAVLLVGLLVLLLLVRSCASGGGGSRPAAVPTPVPTPVPTARATPAPARTPAPTAAPVAPVALCPDAALTLTATTDAATYALGAAPRITLVVRNTSAAACRRDLGSAAVELLVYSGADRFWSSDDCSQGAAGALVTLPPGGTQAVVRTWPGRRSAPGCGGSKAAATAGTYRVVARVGTRTQDGAVFRLHG